jgi:hypothetical protein
MPCEAVMKKSLPIIIILLLPWAVAACSNGSDKECIVSSDCEAGLVCAWGSCVPMNLDAVAEAGDVEVADPGHDPDGEADETAQEDVPETAPDADVPQDPAEIESPDTSGNVGDPCTSPEDCTSLPLETATCLTTILTFTFEGGYCTATCDVDPAVCSTNTACVTLMTYSYCLKACTTTDECRVDENYACAQIPTLPDAGTYCIPNLAP